MRTDIETMMTLRNVLDNPNNTFVYNIMPDFYQNLKAYLKGTKHPQVNFDEFLQGGFEVPRLPQLNNIVQRCYRQELENGRSAQSEDQKHRATTIIHGMFDPSVFGGDTANYFKLFREMISDEKYNPGIRFILLEDPLLAPKISEKKGTDNPLYQAVSYVNMETGQTSKIIQ
jgi:hypothetical protein